MITMKAFQKAQRQGKSQECRKIVELRRLLCSKDFEFIDK